MRKEKKKSKEKTVKIKTKQEDIKPEQKKKLNKYNQTRKDNIICLK